MTQVLCVGSREFLKQKLLSYCFNNFRTEKIWLVDSLQIFDPYWLSRQDVARTREMLDSIRISRPFTLFQLRDKLFSFTKIPLTTKSTIIVSALDCFQDASNAEEEAIYKTMGWLLNRLHSFHDCKMLLSMRTKALAKLFGGGEVWEEQLCQ